MWLPLRTAEMPTFSLLAEFCHFLGIFPPSRAGFMNSCFCRIIKNSTFLSLNGLFQAHNEPKRGRLRFSAEGTYDAPPDHLVCLHRSVPRPCQLSFPHFEKSDCLVYVPQHQSIRGVSAVIKCACQTDKKVESTLLKFNHIKRMELIQ